MTQTQVRDYIVFDEWNWTLKALTAGAAVCTTRRVTQYIDKMTIVALCLFLQWFLARKCTSFKVNYGYTKNKR